MPTFLSSTVTFLATISAIQWCLIALTLLTVIALCVYFAPTRSHPENQAGAKTDQTSTGTNKRIDNGKEVKKAKGISREGARRDQKAEGRGQQTAEHRKQAGVNPEPPIKDRTVRANTDITTIPNLITVNRKENKDGKGIPRGTTGHDQESDANLTPGANTAQTSTVTNLTERFIEALENFLGEGKYVGKKCVLSINVLKVKLRDFQFKNLIYQKEITRDKRPNIFVFNNTAGRHDFMVTMKEDHQSIKFMSFSKSDKPNDEGLKSMFQSERKGKNVDNCFNMISS